MTERMREPSRRGRLGEEDLTDGPTPEARHPHGDLHEEHDLTEGPTPETREAVRASERDVTDHRREPVDAVDERDTARPVNRDERFAIRDPERVERVRETPPATDRLDPDRDDVEREGRRGDRQV